MKKLNLVKTGKHEKKSPKQQLEEKSEAQLQEIVRLHKLINEKEAGLREVMRLVDELLLAAVLEHGREENGAPTMILPKWDGGITQKFKLCADKSASTLRLRALERQGKK